MTDDTTTEDAAHEAMALRVGELRARAERAEADARRLTAALAERAAGEAERVAAAVAGERERADTFRALVDEVLPIVREDSAGFDLWTTRAEAALSATPAPSATRTAEDMAAQLRAMTADPTWSLGASPELIAALDEAVVALRVRRDCNAKGGR